MSGATRAALSVIGGLLLGFSFPPFETGMLAAAGFVPLLLMAAAAEDLRSALRDSYLTFLAFNLVTLYWPGGFVHGRDGYLMVSGALLLVVHPLFMSVPMAALHLVRNAAGPRAAVLLFPVIWTAFEYAHASTQLSFPWLTIGNTQTYALDVIQIASIAGVYAVSFWIALLNSLLTLLFAAAARGSGGPRRGSPAVYALLAAAVYAVPLAGAPFLRPSAEETGVASLRVAVIQPDTDPFEKWDPAGDDQVRLLTSLTESTLAARGADLVIWPETAVPYYLLSPANAAGFRTVRRFVDSVGVPLLTGIPDIVFYRGGAEEPPSGAKLLPDGTPYETFNSSLLLLPGSDTLQKFAKTLLVPFAERVPFSDVLGFLNAARWNFGLGGWSPGRDTALLRLPLETGGAVGIANLVCYESAFPGYVAGLVRRGAGLVTVVTNDSWWGNTAGPYQHRQFGVVRAVENRRWVVQCANGGISFAVDPAGRIVRQTEMFTRTAFVERVGVPGELTFYTRHGDWFADLCLAGTVFSLAAAFVHRRFTKGREAA